MMKIVFFRHSLLNRGGDKMIAGHASFLAEQGHQVVLVANIVETLYYLHPLVKIDSLKLPGKIGTILSALFTPFPGSLIIVDIIPMACLLSFRNRKRVVYFAQDHDESYYSSPGMRLFIRTLYHFALGRMKIPTIAVSKKLAEELADAFRVVPKVVCNGIDPHVFYPDPHPELVSSKSGKKAVLLLSRSDWRKGFDIAIRVISTVSAANHMKNNIEIWTVGESTGEVFSCLPHRDFGYVDEAALRRIMSSADLFLYPSRHEGFGLMPLEAMACGCPVVCSNASSAVAENGFNACVNDFKDESGLATSVVRVLNDTSLREMLVKNGLRTASEMRLDESHVKFEQSLMYLQE